MPPKKKLRETAKEEKLTLIEEDLHIQLEAYIEEVVKQHRQNTKAIVEEKFTTVINQVPKKYLNMPYEKYVEHLKFLQNLNTQYSKDEVTNEGTDKRLLDKELMRKEKRALLEAEMDDQLNGIALPTVTPSTMQTPACTEFKSSDAPWTITTQGRKPKKNEHVKYQLMATSMTGSPIGLDIDFQQVQELFKTRNQITPYVTGPIPRRK